MNIAVSAFYKFVSLPHFTALRPVLLDAARAALDTHGFGMASVRFICGTQDLHKTLEQKVSGFFGTEDTILYTSCFDANGGLFETLLGDGAPMSGRDHFIAERWENFRALARDTLRESRQDTLPALPALTPDQRRPINHSILRSPRPAPPGRGAATAAASGVAAGAPPGFRSRWMIR